MMGPNVVWRFVVGFLGFVLAIAITVLVILWLRRPLSAFLQRLLDDEEVAKLGASFVALLVALRGLSAAFGYIAEAQLQRLFGGLLEMLVRMADVVQWAAGVAALLYIGYAIRSTTGKKAEAKEG